MVNRVMGSEMIWATYRFIRNHLHKSNPCRAGHSLKAVICAAIEILFFHPTFKWWKPCYGQCYSYGPAPLCLSINTTTNKPAIGRLPSQPFTLPSCRSTNRWPSKPSKRKLIHLCHHLMNWAGVFTLPLHPWVLICLLMPDTIKPPWSPDQESSDHMPGNWLSITVCASSCCMPFCCFVWSKYGVAW